MVAGRRGVASSGEAAMSEAITLATIEGWHVREDNNHYNCGPNIIQVGFVVVECPRLKRFDRRYYRAEANKRAKAGKPIDERTWYVDGTPCASLEEAIERLNKPIEFTEYELEVLEQIPSEFTPVVELRCKIAGIDQDDTGWTHGVDSPLSKVANAFHFLMAKGATEYGRLPMPVEDEAPGRRTIAAVRRKA